MIKIKLYHSIRRLLNGKTAVDNRMKYTVVSFGIALIHLIFAITFGAIRIQVLFIYNVAVTIFYLYHGMVSIRKQRFLFVYIFSMIEILFHASLATWMLGWDWGFNMYTISLVTVSFYFTYTLPKLEGKISVPIITSVIVSVCFILNRVMSMKMEPAYKGDYPEYIKYEFYYFNVVIAFVMLVVFSAFFALEIRYMHKKLERENRRLGEIANFDPLTHLLNRRSMNLHLKSTLDNAEKNGNPFCLMLVDIDDFKKVNDTYGHDCGDEVLVTIAELLSSAVRADDAICRWGGEELLILLRADLDVAKKVAQRICEGIANTNIQYKENEVNVTVTIGMSAYEKDKTIRSMVEEADNNLYYGKNHGKNQYVASE